MECGRRIFHQVHIPPLDNDMKLVKLIQCLGPPTYPVIGNLLQVPTKNFHTEFQKWARECMFSQDISFRTTGR